MPDASLEDALARTEGDADASLKAASTVASSLKRLRAAARAGDLREVRRGLDSSSQAVAALEQQLANTVEGWDFDEEGYLSSGAYLEELVETARRQGLTLYRQDEQVYSYPSLLRVLPSERTVSIDRVKEKRLRPSVLIAHLKEIQGRRPRFKSEAFLESIFRVYERIVAHRGKRHGTVVRLKELYDWLTPRPGDTRDYTIQEFARDIYLLDQSGVTDTRHGARVSFPAATGTRNPAGFISVVTQGGQEKRYFGISFEKAG
jgi:hypothetical protein